MSSAVEAMRRLRFSRELVLLCVLIALVTVMSLLSPLFFTLGNLLTTLSRWASWRSG
jgi:ribose/xylose/arabinose/galactoside ABC-type transport system permease subunit